MSAYLLLFINVYAITEFRSHCADLAFGCRQVEQVACDQPDMGEIISRNPSLRQMLICQFAGASGGGRVYWDCREPESGRPAERWSAYYGYPAMVRVSKKCGASPIDKCSSLVFELYNFQVAKERELLITSRADRRKSREAFAIECVRLEFEATKKAQEYFREHPIAGARWWRDPDYCGIEFAGDFQEFLQFLDEDEDDYDPRKYFGKMYDEIVPDE